MVHAAEITPRKGITMRYVTMTALGKHGTLIIDRRDITIARITGRNHAEQADEIAAWLNGLAPLAISDDDAEMFAAMCRDVGGESGAA